MKKHNTLKVVLVTLLVFLLLSWIFPAAYFSSEFVDQGRVQMGLSDLFNYFMTSLSYFGHYALYLIFVGCFYGVLYKIPAYRTFLDKVVAKVNAKVFLVVVSVLLALGVSVAGLQVGFAIFIPLIVSLILLMGYDKIVAAMVVVGSMVAGLVGTTYAYGNNSLLLGILTLDTDYQVGVRFLILLVAVVLVLFNTFMYIKNNMGEVKASKSTKKEESHKEEVVEEVVAAKEEKKAPAKTAKSTKTAPKKSGSKNTKSTKGSKSNGTKKNVNKAALRDEDIIVVKESVTADGNDDEYLVPTRVEVTHKVWPFVAGFILLFVLLVMAWITWGEYGFGVTLFDDVTTKVTEFELFGFPIFSKVYGMVNSFGNWSVIDMLLPSTLLLVLLVVIYRVKLDDVLDGVVIGAKKALLPAFVCLVLYTMLVTVTYHPFQLSIYKAVLGLTKEFNIATTAVTTLLAAIFNVDPAYTYQAVLPYFTSVVTNVENYPLAGVIAQSMYGFAALFAPSSFVLMCTLAYLKVSYKDWLKNIWKLLLELCVILLIVFIILALI